ncbi:MAG: 30S ribosomal protein S17 [bacterium]|nr:30S ribosomal protein S17 [bacterium]
MSKTQLTGIVVSDKMEKTRVVRVETLKAHPKYQRRYRSHEKYKAHDEENQFHEGDKVVIEESRPLSKDKRWIIIKKI